LEQNGSFSADSAAITSDIDSTGVTVIVCASCRDEIGSTSPLTAGMALADDARRAAINQNVHVRTVECLGNCKRRLSAAIVRGGCWSYVFGDLSATDGADLVAGAKLFVTSNDGLIPWRGRPDCLKRGLVARIPPVSVLEE
jgi:predicted metal-binding protein